jgi:two-component system, response regulator
MNEDFVLLVEDNPDDVALALHAFREIRFPHKTVVARNGTEALDFLFGTGPYAGRDKTVTPLLILIDLKLPLIGGLEVLRRLKADPLLKHIVVVVLTSSTEESDHAKAKDLGTNLYIHKPTNFDDFVIVMKRVLHMLSALKRPQPARIK